MARQSTVATEATTNTKAPAKKITNFNAMRPTIVAAHKAGNRKAITKDIVQGCDIDNEYFVMWQADCNKLRLTVADYVLKKRAVKYGYQMNGVDVTEDDVFAARERIFPKWKEILQVGETSKDKKELHVDLDDVEDLIGLVWDFMDSGKGTVEIIVSDQTFRKKVESLLGCAIAKNALLEDADRDTLSAFRSAERRIQNCIDAQGELDIKKKNFELMLGGIPETETKFIEYVKAQIAAVDEELKANKESKAKAEADQKKYNKDAKAILQRIRYAK